MVEIIMLFGASEVVKVEMKTIELQTPVMTVHNLIDTISC